MFGEQQDAVKARLGRILEAAEPLASDDEVYALLGEPASRTRSCSFQPVLGSLDQLKA